MPTPTENEVLTAADAIVRAFAATDTNAYFRGFSTNASFVFHPESERLNSRFEYEKLWQQWLDNGWRVTACKSTDRLVQNFPGGAVFSHTVHTSITSNEGSDSYTERETIVFQASESRQLIAIHEHLSTVLAANGPQAKESTS